MDYDKNDLGGDLKGNVGTDFGIGDKKSKTYQEGAGFYSKPAVQVATTVVPVLGK